MVTGGAVNHLALLLSQRLEIPHVCPGRRYALQEVPSQLVGTGWVTLWFRGWKRRMLQIVKLIFCCTCGFESCCSVQVLFHMFAFPPFKSSGFTCLFFHLVDLFEARYRCGQKYCTTRACIGVSNMEVQYERYLFQYWTSHAACKSGLCRLQLIYCVIIPCWVWQLRLCVAIEVCVLHCQNWLAESLEQAARLHKQFWPCFW